MKVNDFEDMLNRKGLKNTPMSDWFKAQIKYNDAFIDANDIFSGIRTYDGGLVIGYRYSRDTIVDMGCVAEWNVSEIRDVTKADLFRISRSWQKTGESFEPKRKPALTYAL